MPFPLAISAYEAIIDFIAFSPSTSAVAEFQPTQEQKARIADLLRQERDCEIIVEEKVNSIASRNPNT